MEKLGKLLITMVLLTAIVTGCTNTKQQETEAGASKEIVTSESAKEDTSWPRTITDAAGHEVVLEKQPKRITLLHTFYMEHFLALGTPPSASAFGNVMGQKSPLENSEMFEPYLEGLEIMDLGSAREINLEAILESKPDVIVTFSIHGGLDKVYDQLTQIAPVILLDYAASWQNQLRSCAEIVGKEEIAESLITEIDKEISETKEAMAQHKDRAFSLFRTDGKNFITRADAKYYETFGLTKPEGYPDNFETISLEAVADMNPYYIVFQHNQEASDSFVKSLESSAVWKSLDAVKNGRIYYFDENMNTFGPLAMRLTSKKLMEVYNAK